MNANNLGAMVFLLAAAAFGYWAIEGRAQNFFAAVRGGTAGQPANQNPTVQLAPGLKLQVNPNNPYFPQIASLPVNPYENQNVQNYEEPQGMAA
jgi:hypothetical protein